MINLLGSISYLSMYIYTQAIIHYYTYFTIRFQNGQREYFQQFSWALFNEAWSLQSIEPSIKLEILYNMRLKMYYSKQKYFLSEVLKFTKMQNILGSKNRIL